MASYDLLKTITIDGTTMGVDTTVGTQNSFRKTGIHVPSSGTFVEGAVANLEANSFYMIQMETDYPAATSTGATWHRLGGQLGSGGNTFQLRNEISATNEAVSHTVTIGYKTGNADDTFIVRLNSNRDIYNVTSKIHIYKLLSY